LNKPIGCRSLICLPISSEWKGSFVQERAL
jgi:hypothetical protein